MPGYPIHFLSFYTGDHRLVMAKYNINWQRKTPGKVKTRKYDVDKLQLPEYRAKYQQRVKELLLNSEARNEQESWDNITEACHKASDEILGRIKTSRNSKAVDNEDVKKMSEEQKKIRMDINATADIEKRKQLQIRRNKIMKDMGMKIKEIEEKKIIENMEEIENSKEDSTRMYKAIKIQQRNRPNSRGAKLKKVHY